MLEWGDGMVEAAEWSNQRRARPTGSEQHLIHNQQVVLVEPGRVASVAYNETGSVKVHAFLVATEIEGKCKIKN